MRSRSHCCSVSIPAIPAFHVLEVRHASVCSYRITMLQLLIRAPAARHRRPEFRSPLLFGHELYSKDPNNRPPDPNLPSPPRTSPQTPSKLHRNTHWINRPQGPSYLVLLGSTLRTLIIVPRTLTLERVSSGYVDGVFKVFRGRFEGGR